MKDKGLINQILIIFLAYSIVGALSPNNPQFTVWGYSTIGAYVVGLGFYYKKKYF
jgi:hypothetical protein